jgi:hypothetical protein
VDRRTRGRQPGQAGDIALTVTARRSPSMAAI